MTETAPPAPPMPPEIANGWNLRPLMLKCQACDGVGSVTVNPRERHLPKAWRMTCERCNGRGVVRAYQQPR